MDPFVGVDMANFLTSFMEVLMQDGGWTHEWNEEERSRSFISMDIAERLKLQHTQQVSRGVQQGWSDMANTPYGRVLKVEEEILVADFVKTLEHCEPFDITQEP